MWSVRILSKYILVQLLEIAVFVLLLMLVGQWIHIPLWLKWGLIGLCVAKEIISYPLVWRSYDWGYREENNPMMGLSGIAKDRLDPYGYIIVRGELWKAKVAETGLTIEKDANVLVRGIKGLTLLVEPEKKGLEKMSR